MDVFIQQQNVLTMWLYLGNSLNITFQDKDSFVNNDKTDWIFDVSKVYVKKVKVGLFAICEVVDDLKDKIKYFILIVL